MIEICQLNNVVTELKRIEDLTINYSELLYVKLTDYTESDINKVAKAFELDLRSLNGREDIEISSHYVDLANQLSLNLSIPIYSEDAIIVEENIHIIMKENIVFVFLSKGIEETINQLTNLRYDTDNMIFNSHLEFLVFQIGLFSDYYADMVESISGKIKTTYYHIMEVDNPTDNKFDLLTKYNFSNFLLRESVSEYQRVVLLLRKKFSDDPFVSDRLEMEIGDLSVISEHIQYNFDRIGDLKINIASKIELEQNKIFKILTIITVCVSLPTLIAGIYGMNFNHMPELGARFGYPVVLVAIILSFLLPLLYFKRKKWF